MRKVNKMNIDQAIDIIIELQNLLNVSTFSETLAYIRNNADSLTYFQRQAYVVFVTYPHA
jgi:hypothetical protein